jgi:hypothetical protein
VRQELFRVEMGVLQIAYRSPKLAANSRSSSVILSRRHSSHRRSKSSAAVGFNGSHMITHMPCNRALSPPVMVWEYVCMRRCRTMHGGVRDLRIHAMLNAVSHLKKRCLHRWETQTSAHSLGRGLAAWPPQSSVLGGIGLVARARTFVSMGAYWGKY